MAKCIGRLIVITCMAVCLVMISACAPKPNASHTARPSQDSPAETLQWLFVINADQGKIYRQNNKTYLALTGVAEDMSAFTIRPDKDYASIPTQAFMAHWARDAQNAVLQSDAVNVVYAEMTSDDADSIKPAIMKLCSPKIVANSDGMVFEVVHLNTDDHSIDNQEYNDVSVFIDGNSQLLTYLDRVQA